VKFVGEFVNIGDLLGGSGPDHVFGRDGVVLGLISGVKVNIGAGGADGACSEDSGKLSDEFRCDRIKGGHGDFPDKEIQVESILTLKI
jgi:hypothetical protein